MKIIKNNLMTNKNMSKLIIEDEYYKIAIYYVGNYAEDIKTKLDTTYLSANIKPKNNFFNILINFNKKEIYIDENYFFIHEKEIEKEIEKLKLIKKEIEKIKEYLQEYFYKYYD